MERKVGKAMHCTLYTITKDWGQSKYPLKEEWTTDTLPVVEGPTSRKGENKHFYIYNHQKSFIGYIVSFVLVLAMHD